MSDRLTVWRKVVLTVDLVVTIVDNCIARPQINVRDSRNPVALALRVKVFEQEILASMRVVDILALVNSPGSRGESQRAVADATAIRFKAVTAVICNSYTRRVVI